MITDRLFGLLAPHQCIACATEGSLLCVECLETAGEPVVPRCAGCHILSDNYKTCRNCKSWLRADGVVVATSYEGIYEQLIHCFKFEAKRQAAEPIAQIMTEAILSYDDSVVICPLPTAPSRIRQRGFDHTLLLGRLLAQKTDMSRQNLLSRKTNVRQLGASRAKRLEQMEKEFYTKNPEMVKGRSILLIDDVITTGASIAGATKALKDAGAKQVYALVFAQKI
jgi:ComF family protein